MERILKAAASQAQNNHIYCTRGMEMTQVEENRDIKLGPLTKPNYDPTGLDVNSDL